MSKLIVVCMLLISMLGACGCGSSSATNKNKSELANIVDTVSGKNSKELKQKFDKIELGTTMEEVRKIMGDKGKVTIDKTNKDIEDKKQRIQELTITDNYVFFFINGKLEEKKFIE